MKSIFLFLLLIAGCSAIAQFNGHNLANDSSYNNLFNSCHCSILPVASMIPTYFAKARFSVYAEKKQKSGQPDVADGEIYDTAGFLDLINKILGSDYDGFRTYFATYPSHLAIDSGGNNIPEHEDGKFTIIFVPTRNGASSDIHLDDVNNCMIIKGKEAIHIDAKFASWWIRKAQEGILKKFEKCIEDKSKKKKFYETHSLWYNIKELKHRKILKNGLIDVLKCLICSNAIDHVSVRFGGFLATQIHGFHYKLTQVFTFEKDGIPDYFTLSSSSGSAGTDTGKPCPPPNPPGTCAMVGSQLPNQ